MRDFRVKNPKYIHFNRCTVWSLLSVSGRMYLTVDFAAREKKGFFRCFLRIFPKKERGDVCH